MAEIDLFESATSSTGDMAGVFEFDDDTGYFYLYDTGEAQGQKILGAIQVLVGSPDFQQDDIAIRWNASDSMVGLFVRDQLWAAFDVKNGAKYGGNYSASGSPEIPKEISRKFNIAG